ncbi:hypothetical protein A8990_1506 [Paenibacillus taihuensis]|uniref:Uncharacterized protein n=1 Tax=Paenibacillus taihuensis TaxID=1156355 RepID=A0A3D9QTG3_9BACL|nr:hypothetical protein A8990_1506 [Paenibacillus taihuensis]
MPKETKTGTATRTKNASSHQDANPRSNFNKRLLGLFGHIVRIMFFRHSAALR